MGRILALAWLLELVSAPLVMAAAVFYDIQQKVPALVFTLLALGVLAAKRRFRRLARAGVESGGAVRPDDTVATARLRTIRAWE